MDALDEDDYTSSSWSKLEDALDEAIAVLEDEDATQSQVNKAAEKLDKAYKALKRIGGGSSHSGGSAEAAIPPAVRSTETASRSR